MHIGARGDDGCLQKMDTCPTDFPKKKGDMPKNTPHNKHVTAEGGNKCGKVGGLLKQKVSMVREISGR